MLSCSLLVNKQGTCIQYMHIYVYVCVGRDRRPRKTWDKAVWIDLLIRVLTVNHTAKYLVLLGSIDDLPMSLNLIFRSIKSHPL